jgi:hypothetical protein
MPMTKQPVESLSNMSDILRKLDRKIDALRGEVSIYHQLLPSLSSTSKTSESSILNAIAKAQQAQRDSVIEALTERITKLEARQPDVDAYPLVVQIDDVSHRLVRLEQELNFRVRTFQEQERRLIELGLSISRAAILNGERFQRYAEGYFFSPAPTPAAIELYLAFGNLLEHFGLGRIERRSESGSWYSDFATWTREKLSSPEAKKRYRKVEKAIELAMKEKVQAEVDEINSRVVERLSKTLNEAGDCVLIHEAWIALRITPPDGKPRNYIRMLTETERETVRANPTMLRDLVAVEARFFPSRSVDAAETNRISIRCQQQSRSAMNLQVRNS